MDTNAYIEILDTANNVLGSIPVGNNDDFPLVLTDSISDIDNVFKRTSSFSKSARFPADKATNQLLEYLYNSNISDDKDMKNLKDCRLVVNGLQYVNYNKIKLTNVVSSYGRPNEYEYTLYGENFEWVELLKNVYLKDLDYGYYVGTTLIDDVEYNATDILTVMTKDYDDDYDYWWSLKNYGCWQVAGAVSVEDLRPDIYFRSILEKGFEEIGYTIESNFLTGSFFKKLYLPFYGENFKQTQTDLDLNRVLALTAPTQTVTQNNSVMTMGSYDMNIDAQFNTETYDYNSAWNGTTFTAPITGVYKIKGTLNFQIANPNGGNVYFKYRVNSTESQMFDTNGNFLLFTNINSVYSNQTFDYEFDVNLQAGDVFAIVLDLPFFAFATTTILKLTAGSTINILLQEALIDGSTFKIKNIVDPNATVFDQISDLSNLFNLKFKTDTRLKKVYMEPDAIDFYKPTSQAIDITNNFDLGSDYTLSFITDYNRDWEFSYVTDDKDGLVKHLNQVNQTKVGALDVSLPDRFRKGSQKAGTTMFAPTAHIVDGTISDKTTGNGVYMPLFSKDYPSLTGYSTDIKPRCLYQLGWTNHNSCNWYLFSPLLGTTTLQTNAPIGYMQDVILGTGVNLSFDNHSIAGDGIFKTYWDPTFQLIETGIILNAKLKLKATQLSNIDLRYLFYLDGPAELKGYWICDTIGEYNPQNIDLVDVRLVKYTLYNKKSTNTSSGGVSGGTTGTGSSNGNGTNMSNMRTANGNTPSYVLENNTGNQARKNSGNVAFGQGVIAPGKFQSVFGKFNDPNETDIFQFGAGTGPNNRRNAFVINKDGEFVWGDQPIFIEDENGNYIQVVTNRNNTIDFVYIER